MNLNGGPVRYLGERTAIVSGSDKLSKYYRRSYVLDCDDSVNSPTQYRKETDGIWFRLLSILDSELVLPRTEHTLSVY